jgi:hypothetical protein
MAQVHHRVKLGDDPLEEEDRLVMQLLEGALGLTELASHHHAEGARANLLALADLVERRDGRDFLVREHGLHAVVCSDAGTNTGGEQQQEEQKEQEEEEQ